MSTARSRVVAVVGKDGCGKSKVCAALLELAQPDAPPAASPGFADKGRLLERESAEGRRNFTCYNHFYSQQASLYHQFCPRLHLVDTPGHVDRLLHVDEALRVAHGAVVVCSVRGGGAGAASGHIFNAVEESHKPMVVFLNGVDTSDDAVDFEAAVDSLEERLGARPVVLFAPVHASGSKTGSLLLNVLDGTVCSAMECSMGLDDPSAVGGEAVPRELASWAAGLREQLLDALSATDDELMEAYVEHEGKVPRPEIDAALQRAAAAGRVVPLVAGSAKSGLGVDALQEVIQTFIPIDSAADVVEDLGVRPLGGVDEFASAEAHFLGWAVGRRQEFGQCLLHVRVLQGLLKAGQPLKLVGGEAAKADAPGEILRPEEFYAHGPGGELDSVLAAGPGDLVFVPVPMKSVPKGRGEFLLADAKLACASVEPAGGEGHSGTHPTRQGCCTYLLQLGSLDRREQERLLKALEAIREDDAGLRVEEGAHPGETLLTCMGMLHLELLRERLAEEFKVLRLPLGQAHVEYRATLKEASTATGQHQLQGKTRIRKGHAHTHAGKVDAWAKIELEPARRGSGVDIESIAAAQRQALSDGIRRGLETAGPSGIPVVDVRVKVLEAEAHSADAALEAAASAVQRAVQDSHRVALLEPIVDMEVDVPSSTASGVLDDLQNKRRGFVSSHAKDEGLDVIGAEVPLREIRGYSGDLQKLTGGKGLFSFRLQGYREVLPQVEKQILEQDLGVQSTE